MMMEHQAHITRTSHSSRLIIASFTYLLRSFHFSLFEVIALLRAFAKIVVLTEEKEYNHLTQYSACAM